MMNFSRISLNILIDSQSMYSLASCHMRATCKTAFSCKLPTPVDITLYFLMQKFDYSVVHKTFSAQAKCVIIQPFYFWAQLFKALLA